MRLATRANGTPDGELIVVSAAGDRFLPASDIVPTLLAALEQWSAVAPMLQARAELIAVLGYRHDELAERRLDAVVGRLRRKLESQSGEAFPIKTLHAIGYIFSAPVDVIDGAVERA